MIITLHREVLSDPEAQLDLMMLIWAAFHRGYPLLFEDIDPGEVPEVVEKWLASLPSSVAETITLLLDDHTVQAATSPTQTTLHVRARGHAAELRWPELHLPYDRAAIFAVKPLGLVLEDRRSDYAFLLAAAPRRWREQIEEAIDSGALEIVHGGGLGSMLHRVRELHTAETAARTWVLFDSDAPMPGSPSSDSERLRRACEERRDRGLGHHQLRARSIENYVPLELLKTWASTVGGTAPTKVDRISACSRDERDHLRLKREFDDGHGKRIIADLFIDRYRFSIEEDSLRREGHLEEVHQICESIMAYI